MESAVGWEMEEEERKKGGERGSPLGTGAGCDFTLASVSHSVASGAKQCL